MSLLRRLNAAANGEVMPAARKRPKVEATPPPAAAEFFQVAAGGTSEEKLCKCGLVCRKSKCGPSSKPENVGKYFYACPKPRETGCKFFEFVEPTAAPAVKYVPPPRVEHFVMPRERQDVIDRLGLRITESQAREIENYDQRSDKWLLARKGRLTASSFGSAAGHNSYQSPTALLKELLWGTFKGNSATRHGTFHESLACSVYEVQRKAEWCTRYRSDSNGLPSELPFEVKHPGLIINPAKPWFGASPDGVVYTLDYATLQPVIGLLEIKAPATGQVYEDQAKYQNDKPWNGVPQQYWDQIQGVMYLLNLPWCDFFVWTVDKFTLRRYQRDDAYCADLMDKLEKFYFERYAPALLLKEAGRLQEGEVEESFRV